MANSWFNDPALRLAAQDLNRPLYLIQAIVTYIVLNPDCYNESDNESPYNARLIAIATGCDVTDVTSVTVTLGNALRNALVTRYGNGGNAAQDEFSNQSEQSFEKQQYIRSKNAEKQRRYREKMTVTRYGNVTVDNGNALPVTPSSFSPPPCSPPSLSPITPISPPPIIPPLTSSIPSPISPQSLETAAEPPAVARKRAGDENYYTADFNEFWEVYPSNGRAKGSKHGAAKAYAKAIKISSTQQILEGIQSYEQYLSGSGQLNKDASTWLNQRGWADTYAATQIIRPVLQTANARGSRQARLHDFAASAMREWADSIPLESFDDGDSSSEYIALSDQSSPAEAAGQGRGSRYQAERFFQVA